MRSAITYTYQSVTLISYTGGGKRSKPVLSRSGRARADSITLQRTSKDRQLTELLNSLERQAEILENKSLRALNMWLTDITHLVMPTDIALEEAGIR